MTAPADLALPPDVAAALDALRAALHAAAPGNVAAIALYGGLARGRYVAGSSDVNLLLVMRDASAARLAAIAPALRAAWRAARVEPFVLTPEEIEPAARAFPTKLLDIQQRHVMLEGDDPLATLVVSREHVRLRAEQELRNVALRLRRRLLAAFDDRTELAAAADNAVAPLAVNLSALLFLADASGHAEDASTEVFARAGQAFDLDHEVLDALRGLRGGAGPREMSVEMFGRVLALVERVTELAAGSGAGGA